MANRVVVRDRGAEKLLKDLEASGRLHLKVGVYGSAAAQDHAGISNGEIAAIHELGLGNNPRRSWLADWLDVARQPILDTFRREFMAVLRQRQDERRALNRAGAAFVGQIQERIAQGIPPTLAPVTIRRKGSSVPLIDTGQFRRSISHEVSR